MINNYENLLMIYQNCPYRLESCNKNNSGIKVIMILPNLKEIQWDLSEPSDIRKWELFLKAMEE